MPGKARMNAVRGPEGGRAEEGVRGKNPVVRNKPRGKFTGQLPGDMDFRIQILPPRGTVRRTRQNKRLADDDSDSLVP